MLDAADRHDESAFPPYPSRPVRQYREEDTNLEQLDRLPYETPMVLDTFDAHEVMDIAEGSIVIGNGSQTPA